MNLGELCLHNTSFFIRALLKN